MASADRLLFFLKLFSALGCGLTAGVFFAFSSFVMNALGRLPPAQGIAAMQSINIAVINPWFFTPFFGTAAICLYLVFRSLSSWNQPGSSYVLAGCLLYLAGTILVTLACNVPLNNALAGVKPESAEGARLWAAYLVRWTTWNHVRGIAALAAATLFTLASCQRVPQ
jgi:uncharacterized membrane protein